MYIHIYIYIYPSAPSCARSRWPPGGRRARRAGRRAPPFSCVYIYIEREREREIYTYIYRCIYIYIYTY